MTAYEWSPPYSAWTYLALALALAVLLLLARRGARLAASRRWSLVLLRGAALALLVFILLNPVQVTETRLPTRPAELVYLVDCSRSMALDRPVSRLDQVKRTIEQHGQGLDDNRLRVKQYRFGDRLEAAAGPDDLRPSDDATRLREALERLPARFTDGLPAGVVIFSDGRTTEPDGFDDLAAGYRRLGVPLHVFPVGDRVAGDVAIQDVIAPRDAPAGTRLPVRVVLRSRGYQGSRAEVRIRSASEPARKPLAVLPVTLADGQQTHELLIDHALAPSKLVVEVSPLAGEAILENNQVAFQIGARRSKVRVIYMEGTLANEYHWIRDALVEDPNIECLAIEVNFQYADRPTLHRVNEPGKGYPTTREELFGYDVVICSDINRTAFNQEQLDWTVELVHKRGGGFAMIGGNTSFGAGNWDKTVWDGLIPVDMGGQANSPGRGTSWGTSFFVKVPKEVERHPIWRIVEDPAKNRQILDRIPNFTGTNLIERLKPAATPLGYSDRPLPRVGVMPVFSCEPFGKGRTFAMSTDSTADWGQFFERNWGEAGDNRYFRKFWRNVVLWLAENSGDSNRRLRVEADKVIYRPGQPIKVLARAYDDKMEETGGYRLVARLQSPAVPTTVLQESPLEATAVDHAYVGEVPIPPLNELPAAPGNNPLLSPRLLALHVTAYDKGQDVTRTTLEVQVMVDSIEFHDPQPDPERLEEIARISGGKVLHGVEDLARLADAIPTRKGESVVQKAPLWDHGGLWFFMLTLLTAEWMLRRWLGLA